MVINPIENDGDGCAVTAASVSVAQVSRGSHGDDEEETMIDVGVAEVCFVCVEDCARDPWNLGDPSS